MRSAISKPSRCQDLAISRTRLTYSIGHFPFGEDREFGPAPSGGSVLVRRDASRPVVDERVLLGVTFRDEPLVEETWVSSGWLARLDALDLAARRHQRQRALRRNVVRSGVARGAG